MEGNEEKGKDIHIHTQHRLSLLSSLPTFPTVYSLHKHAPAEDSMPQLHLVTTSDVLRGGYGLSRCALCEHGTRWDVERCGSDVSDCGVVWTHSSASSPRVCSPHHANRSSNHRGYIEVRNERGGKGRAAAPHCTQTTTPPHTYDPPSCSPFLSSWYNEVRVWVVH
jgi:hypothetical protein